jgi:CDP-diglyceride synthetase
MSRTDRLTLTLRGGAAALVAVVVNAALVAIAQALNVAPGFMALSYPPVAFLSAVGAVGATVVYALIARRRDDPDPLFVRVAGVVLVLSFLPDVGLLFGDEAATIPGVVVLMLMHVVVAAASVRLLTQPGALAAAESASEPRNA